MMNMKTLQLRKLLEKQLAINAGRKSTLETDGKCCDNRSSQDDFLIFHKGITVDCRQNILRLEDYTRSFRDSKGFLFIGYANLQIMC